jgi:nucleotide-binding universal stress UspA family protein
MSETVILVPLDGSQQALAALPVAKVLAEIEGAVLHILHVAERAPEGAEWRSRLEPDALALDSFTIDARIGEPMREILDVAARIKPRLIVMCKHSGAARRKMLGRTATEVLRNSPCPVVFVPPERGSTPWHLHHVLVPHDGTPTTSAALPPAAELAERGRAELLVAHVTGISASPAEPGSLTTPRYVDAPQHEWPAWTSEFINRLASVCPLGSLPVRMLLAGGNTAAEIVRLAATQSTDLIVLAWRGKWEAPRAETLKDIVREAHCPIMVVRA